jgi:hypothetical protein
MLSVASITLERLATVFSTPVRVTHTALAAHAQELAIKILAILETLLPILVSTIRKATSMTGTFMKTSRTWIFRKLL